MLDVITRGSAGVQDVLRPDPAAVSTAVVTCVAPKLRLSDVLHEFARALVTDFPVQAILDHLVQQVMEILPISAAGVTLLSPGFYPQYCAASDDLALRSERLQTELGEGPCLAAYNTGQAVSVPDLPNEQRFPTWAPRALEEGLVAVFTFPLRNGPTLLGALDLYRTTAGALDDEAMRAAQTLADVAAAYLLNAQARADLEESSERALIEVQEQERRQIASDIHDDSVQAIIAAQMRLQRLQRRVNDPTMAALVDDIERAMAEAVVRLRRLMFDLSPPILDEEGVGSALRAYLVKRFNPLGLAWTLVDDITVEPEQTTKALAYRLTRELLSNVLKHAYAKQVLVTMKTADGGVAITVTDDGISFDTSKRHGMAGDPGGLSSLSTTTKAARGRYSAESAPGVGTTSHLWLPDTKEPEPALADVLQDRGRRRHRATRC